MEALYTKLYNKYSKLKKEQESQFDQLNHDQEVKFLNYVDGVDECINYLKSENDKLLEQVDDLKKELASFRASSDEQLINLQKSLTEEKQKNQEYSEEILRLKEIAHGQENLNDTSGKQPQGSLTKSVKKRKSIHISEGTAGPYVDVEHGRSSDQIVSISIDKSNGAPSIQQPACCQRKTSTSVDGDAADSSSFSCLFQDLVEFVVGLKVSPLIKSNEISILAHHQSSGYKFTLTWITKLDGEVEMLYRVLSLGTFERVAPQFMKETIMFSTSMCKVFFTRVSRVINS